MTRHLLRAFAAAVLVATSATASGAQAGRPKAEVTTAIGTAAVHAGAAVTATLRVALPADVHVQSDRPRDPSLIPTALTIQPPAGVTVVAISYPPSTDLQQAGQKAPLAVLGPVFTIDARLTLAADVPAGQLLVPGRLRYQACDDKACYPPVRADVQWVVTVQ